MGEPESAVGVVPRNVPVPASYVLRGDQPTSFGSRKRRPCRIGAKRYRGGSVASVANRKISRVAGSMARQAARSRQQSDEDAPDRPQTPPTPQPQRNKWLVQETFSRVRSVKSMRPGDETRMLVEELREFVADFKKSDCDPFWRRKSDKVVLAVLMVRYGGARKFFKGINSEISLPVGSNCAERAAISAALSHYLDIKRENFRAIAVLDPDPSPSSLNPIAPCGVCDEWLKKIQEKAPHFRVLAFGSSLLDEVIERCPTLFVEEHMQARKPKLLSQTWSCRCGSEFNPPDSSRCVLCHQFRYNFRPCLHRERETILSAIASSSEECLGGCTLDFITAASKLPDPQVYKTLYDLKSLKFVEQTNLFDGVSLSLDGGPAQKPVNDCLEWESDDSKASPKLSPQPSPRPLWSITALGLNYLNREPIHWKRRGRGYNFRQNGRTPSLPALVPSQQSPAAILADSTPPAIFNHQWFAEAASSPTRFDLI